MWVLLHQNPSHTTTFKTKQRWCLQRGVALGQGFICIKVWGVCFYRKKNSVLERRVVSHQNGLSPSGVLLYTSTRATQLASAVFVSAVGLIREYASRVPPKGLIRCGKLKRKKKKNQQYNVHRLSSKGAPIKSRHATGGEEKLLRESERPVREQQYRGLCS